MTPPETHFTAGETHGRALRPENELLAHSQDVGWRSLHAAIFKEAPLHVTESALDHPFIIYHITHPCEVTRTIEGARREKALLGPRNICLTPPEAVTEWEHHGHPEILQVYLRRSLYEAAEVDGATTWQQFVEITLPMLLCCSRLRAMRSDASAPPRSAAYPLGCWV